MKAKEVGKLLAVSSLTLGIGAAGIFNLAACGYGPMENHVESESFEPDDNNAVCEYGVFEIDDTDAETDSETDTIETVEENDIYSEPVEVYGSAPDDFDVTTEETEEFVPEKQEIPSVYGVPESYDQE